MYGVVVNINPISINKTEMCKSLLCHWEHWFLSFFNLPASLGTWSSSSACPPATSQAIPCVFLWCPFLWFDNHCELFCLHFADLCILRFFYCLSKFILTFNLYLHLHILASFMIVILLNVIVIWFNNTVKTPSIYSEMGGPVLCQTCTDRATTQQCPGSGPVIWAYSLSLTCSTS